jgi:chemotaxis protein MotA
MVPSPVRRNHENNKSGGKMKFVFFIISFTCIIFFTSSSHEGYEYILSNMFSIIFVLGGTLVSTVISYSPEKIMRVKSVITNTLRTEKFDFAENTKQIIQFTREYRKSGFKTLENSAKQVSNPYLKLCMEMIEANCTWEQLMSAVEKEAVFDSIENDQAQKILRAMAKYAPAFGLTGTIIGLMKIFPQLSNPANIGSSMSLALLTTLYGVLFSNLIFTPLSNKLKDNASENELVFRFITEALQCIRQREYSIVTEQKLSCLMPKHQLKKYEFRKTRHVKFNLKMAENS